MFSGNSPDFKCNDISCSVYCTQQFLKHLLKYTPIKDATSVQAMLDKDSLQVTSKNSYAPVSIVLQVTGDGNKSAKQK